MKRVLSLGVFAVLIVAGVSFAAHTPAQQNKAPLVLIHRISLPGIHGDFDHFAADNDGHRLFLAAEEHKTVEVIDTQTNKVIHSIGGLDTPHSLVYVPDSSKLFVIDGGDHGSCKIFDAKDYHLLQTIDLAADADSMVYDADKKLLYVANGGKDAGWSYSFISIIDAEGAKKTGEIRVESNNIEAMAIEKSGPRLFANMRDQNKIGVIDREKKSVLTTWDAGVQHNTPLALDETNHRLFVVGRGPGKFAVLDTESGKVVTTMAATDLADDMTFDSEHKRIYVACGAGDVDVFTQQDPDHYELSAKVPSGFRAKTAILLPQIGRYYLTVVAHNGKSAAVNVYKVQN